ncbi:outer membrane beta-barrel protein [Ideonella sp. YS5]|uniref:outer membrane beta-barrel protein n=1 Tax=Ideonella sp. YS5 TaxID=3453714 RepID=UPI003EEA840C
MTLASDGAWAQDAGAAAAPAAEQAAPQASVAPPGEGAASRVARVRVIGPYLDLRSGPGRGYPIFYAAERGEWVVIELRHTDWFKVRTPRGTSGWVSREQMKQTVTEDGVPFELADPSLQDWLQRRFEVGVGYGANRSGSTSFTRAWAGWRFTDTLSLDLNFGDVQTKTATATLWTASLLAEPWSDKRLSPFVGVGVGRFDYKPNDTLVNNQLRDGNMGVFTLGARYFLSGRVALRVDYSRYAVFVSDTDYRNYQGGTIGLSLHF